MRRQIEQLPEDFYYVSSNFLGNTFFCNLNGLWNLRANLQIYSISTISPYAHTYGKNWAMHLIFLTGGAVSLQFCPPSDKKQSKAVNVRKRFIEHATNDIHNEVHSGHETFMRQTFRGKFKLEALEKYEFRSQQKYIWT